MMEFLSNFNLKQAITHCGVSKSLICVTRQNKTDWQIYKTKAVSSSKNGITIGERQLVYGREGNPSDQVGISFRQGNHKLLFHTTLKNDTLICPNYIIKVSRHSYRRQSLKKSITVNFWSSEKIHCGQLIDFSAGGMQVSASNHNYDDGPYSCRIDYPKFSITANAILSKGKTLSFKFVGSEFNKQTISKLVKFTQELKRQHRSRCCLNPSSQFQSYVA